MYPREATRLRALQSLHLLDTEANERYDRLTRLALRLLDVPIALVTLVDQDRQWFKSNLGLPMPETPRDVSFCGHVVSEDNVLVVPDTLEDDRFCDNPLVTGEPRIRFYAGVPIHSDGMPIGTLCAIDVQPREYAKEDVAALSDLARLVEDELSRDADVFIDELTGLLNRRGFDAIAQVLVAIADRSSREVAVAFGDLDGLKSINDSYGHAEGDRAIVAIASILGSSFRRADAVARLSGDEFCVLMMSGEEFTSGVALPLERFYSALTEHNAGPDHEYELSMSIGVATTVANGETDIEHLIAEADAKMYATKAQRRPNPTTRVAPGERP